MLGELETETGRIVVADLEAGVGTLVRSEEGQVDMAILVVEPYATSIETARRLLGIVADRLIGRTIVVANKVARDDDLAFIRDALGIDPDVVVPSDPAVALADLEGVAPFDHAPDGPAVSAVRDLSARILALGGPGH